jgi:hypothetical protein
VSSLRRALAIRPHNEAAKKPRREQEIQRLLINSPSAGIGDAGSSGGVLETSPGSCTYAVNGSAHCSDMASVDPTLLRGREVSHLHPTIFARDHAEFGVLSNHADSSC